MKHRRNKVKREQKSSISIHENSSLRQKRPKLFLQVGVIQ